MQPTTLEILATIFFSLAMIHSFLVSRFEHWAKKFKPESIWDNLFHLLGEVEIVFGLWAGAIFLVFIALQGPGAATRWVDLLNFREPVFVFSIMVVSATQPVVYFVQNTIESISQRIPLPRSISFFAVTLILGPLMGSFITEPAAITVTALLLKRYFSSPSISAKTKYLALGALLVNVSIGGVLTHFAAPPVLMVAAAWQWTTPFMAKTFGWKAALGVVINTALVTTVLTRDLRKQGRNLQSFELKSDITDKFSAVPLGLSVIHFVFLGLLVLSAHHPALLMGVFLFFLGFVTITREHQSELKLREGLLVGFFLAGLVALGNLQTWWLAPLLRNLTELPMFLGATALTAITDNAALTYLGAQAGIFSESLRYALVAGAVAGGGLTVMANAPNPAAFSILKESFGDEGISPIFLFVAAIPSTLIAMACFYFLG